MTLLLDNRFSCTRPNGKVTMRPRNGYIISRKDWMIHIANPLVDMGFPVHTTLISY